MATEIIRTIRGSSSQWRDIRWLAWREIRQNWWGYPASAAYMVGLGALIAPRGEAGLGTSGVELPFLIMMLILTEPFFSWEYLSWENDRMSARLTFLRLMPIPLEVIVGSRMIRLLSAAVLNVPAFFIPLWLLGEWDLRIGSYIGFILFWTGLSAIATGYGLCMEMSTSIRRYVVTNLILMALMIPAILYLGIAHDLWAMQWTAGIAEDHPVLLALSGVVVGIAGYLGLGVVARNRLAGREMTP